MADDTPTAEEQHAALGIDPATGFATDGEFPINHRLRAEALHAAGLASDPHGMVSDELIADAGQRVEADRAAAEKAEADAKAAKPSTDWSKPDLLKEAADRGVSVPSGATKDDIVGALENGASTGQEG